MDNSEIDSDGFSESNRRCIVDTAVSRVRSRGIEPHPDLLFLYELYARGDISKEELNTRMHNRLNNLITDLQHQGERRERFEYLSSHEWSSRETKGKKEPGRVEGGPSTHRPGSRRL